MPDLFHKIFKLRDDLVEEILYDRMELNVNEVDIETVREVAGEVTKIICFCLSRVSDKKISSLSFWTTLSLTSLTYEEIAEKINNDLRNSHFSKKVSAGSVKKNIHDFFSYFNDCISKILDGKYPFSNNKNSV